ncbi:MAG: HAMP domain-containing protein [Phycisphaerales bacterium]|nr:HAMP domain-containing protein [Phycisphaerales bacterium]
MSLRAWRTGFRRLRGGAWRSLELRLFIPLALTLAAVLVLHSALSYRSSRSHFARLMSAEVERSAGLVKGAMHDGMLLNRLDDVQVTLERLAQAPEVASIRVFNTRGRIVLSGDPTERGLVVASESEVCVGCHRGGTPSAGCAPSSLRERRMVTVADDGHEIMRRLSVIENGEGCATATCHFHAETDRALGVLDVGMSMEPFDTAVAASQRQLVWTTVVLVAVCGSVVALFIRRVVHAPVRRLHEGTLRVAAGDLETRIEVRGGDELARLAGAFNGMAAELGAARRELTAWSATLEQRVEAKTLELRSAERQVRHMETMASLGKLSATVAHELNNPLSGILTYARLVRRELAERPVAGGAELDRYLSLVDKECSRCGAIVHNLLTFARRKGEEMAPVDVSEVIDRSLMLIRHHLEMRRIRLCAGAQGGDGSAEIVAEIVADGGQVEQALLALLMNAVEAMPERPGVESVLTVRLRGIDEGSGGGSGSGGGGWVEIEVEDTGVGIAPEVLPHIFEPFYSTKSGGGAGEGGVGLGLAVVYGIVQRHGGTVGVRSEVGLGTTFTLRLPRRASEAGGDGEAAR